MKFVFVKSKHNIFHWLIVVLIKTFYFLILGPIGLYLMITGLILFEITIAPFPPSAILKQINDYFSQLPYITIISKLVKEYSNLYARAPTWWAVVVAIPLILIGNSIFLINLFDFISAIFSLSYSRTHCPFCKKPIIIKHD